MSVSLYIYIYCRAWCSYALLGFFGLGVLEAQGVKTLRPSQAAAVGWLGRAFVEEKMPPALGVSDLRCLGLRV